MEGEQPRSDNGIALNCTSFTASFLPEFGFQEAKLGLLDRVIGNGKGTGVSAFSEVLQKTKDSFKTI